MALGDLRACFAFDNNLKRFTVTGDQLRCIFTHIMRPENRDGEEECYEVNAAVRAVNNDQTRLLESLSLEGKPVENGRLYTIALTGYHIDNCTKNLHITPDELVLLGGTKIVATSTNSVLEEYLREYPNLSSKIEGRLVYR